MRTFTSALLLASAAAVASAQSTSTSASTSASGSSTMSSELAAIPTCNTTQLNAAEAILTSNQREAQCEEALSIKSGTMLQVNTSQATDMCDTASCTAALQELYNEMPNCRYNLWGLQYSAKQLLEYCGITPTNTTASASSSSSGSAGWSVLESSSASFASAGATDAPSTASSTAADSSASATSSGSSAATTTTTVSAALVATAGLVAALLA